MSDTTNLMLPYLAPGQAQKHVTVNEGLRRLDAVVQLSVVSASIDVQPGSPPDGAVWILPPGKTGDAWGPMANHALAYYRDGAWEQVNPRQGWLAYLKDVDGFVYFDGASWEALASGEGGGGGGGGGSPDAADVDFDPSGLAVLTADNVQGALEEIDAALNAIPGGGDYTDEHARDAIAAALIAGTGLSKAVDDPGDTITLAIDTGAEAERIRDVIGAALVAGTNVTITPDDGADTITISASGGGGGDGRERLNADRTYYMRTDGNNANNGLANTSGGAFLTLQKALDVAATIDFNGHTVTIQIGDGTYTGGAVVPRMTGQGAAANLIIKGNTSTPGNVILSVTNTGCIRAGAGAMARVVDMELRTTTLGSCLSARSGGLIEFGNIRFGACAEWHLEALSYGSLYCIGNYAITGGAQCHMLAVTGFIELHIRTVTLSGAPAFALYFVFATTGGVIRLYGVTWSGSASGVRHLADKSGGVETFGAGVNNLPGGSNGTTTAPGWAG